MAGDLYVAGDSFGDVERNYLASQGQMEAARQARVREGMAERQLQMEQQNRAAALQQRERELNIQEGYRRDQAEMNKAHASYYRALTKAYEDGLNRSKDMETPTEAREHEFSFKAAGADSERGMFGSVDDVRKYYPKLSDAEANLFAQRSIAQRPFLEEQYTQAANQRDLANAYKQAYDLTREPDPSDPSKMRDVPFPTRSTGIFGMGSGRPVNERDRLTDRESSLVEAWKIRHGLESMGVHQAIKQSPLIRLSPKTGLYETAVPPWPWMQGGAKAAPSGAGTVREDIESEPTEPTTGTATTGGGLGSSGVSAPARTETVTSTAAAPAEPKVTVRTPDGKTLAVPRSNLAEVQRRAPGTEVYDENEKLFLPIESVVPTGPTGQPQPTSGIRWWEALR